MDVFESLIGYAGNYNIKDKVPAKDFLLCNPILRARTISLSSWDTLK
jgi:hypothetical protein